MVVLPHFHYYYRQVQQSLNSARANYQNGVTSNAFYSYVIFMCNYVDTHRLQISLHTIQHHMHIHNRIVVVILRQCLVGLSSVFQHLVIAILLQEVIRSLLLLSSLRLTATSWLERKSSSSSSTWAKCRKQRLRCTGSSKPTRHITTLFRSLCVCLDFQDRLRLPSQQKCRLPSNFLPPCPRAPSSLLFRLSQHR